MSIRQTGAEFQQVTTGNSTDLVELQRYNSTATNPYWQTVNITLSNLLTGGVDFTTLNLGASGTAGTLNIFPPTAASGNLQFKAANSSGNTITEVINASQSGARVYTIPDAGASASFVMTAGTQTIGGQTTFSTTPIGVAFPVQVYLSPITAQAGAVSVLFAAPYAGTVTKIYGAIGGTIATSDITITPSIYHSGSGTAITSGVVTITASGSNVGTTGVATPSAANTFLAGDVITATVTGGTNTVTGVITLYVTRTA